MATLLTQSDDSRTKERPVKKALDFAIMSMIAAVLLACAGGTGGTGAMNDVGAGGVGGGSGINQAQPTISDANIVPEPIPVEDDEGPPSDFKAPEPEDDDDGPNIPQGPSDLKSK